MPVCIGQPTCLVFNFWNCFSRHISCIFVIFFETNLFLLSHRQVLVLKIGGTALIGGFPVGLMKRKPLFLEENCENWGKLVKPAEICKEHQELKNKMCTSLMLIKFFNLSFCIVKSITPNSSKNPPNCVSYSQTLLLMGTGRTCCRS